MYFEYANTLDSQIKVYGPLGLIEVLAQRLSFDAMKHSHELKYIGGRESIMKK